ncbi:MAG: DHH family phosphoesterase [Thermoanaerobaculia bacterium]
MVTEETLQRLAALRELIDRRTGPGRWLILTHDNPDPDALAAAAALSTLLREGFARRVTTAYGGIIGRAENRQMVKTLRVKPSQVKHLNWGHYKHYALVDCQPGTGNNALPESLVPDLVLDHHPIRRATRSALLTDVRTHYGATATIACEYLLASGITIDRSLATALVYAIRSETQDFGREYSEHDKSIYDLLHAQADLRALARIQFPSLPISYFRTLRRAVANLSTVDSLVVSHLGEVEQPDIVPEIADLLLRLEGKTWSLTSGSFEDRLYLSMRTTNPRADAGRLMRRLLGRRGRGGGHGMIAGGWVALARSEGGAAVQLHRQLATRLASLLKKSPERLAPVPGLLEPSPEVGV